MSATNAVTREWWKTAVFYQVFPASFFDSNSDGYGDLVGLTLKLDYLSWLGVDALWISPIFKSPQFDMGYDVSDYLSVDPLFGSLEEFKKMLSEAHKRNIKVILDMVMNHTSVEHPWFQESKSSKINPKRDWFIWSEGLKFKKPNNWKSLYGGSSWTFDPTTSSYYYHTFFKEQPDLNWRNQQVRQEFSKIVRFWLDMGVDGFRLDAFNVIVKDQEFRSSPPPILMQLVGRENFVTRNHPESYEILQDLRALTDQYKDILLLGEIYTLPPGNPVMVSSYLSGKNNRLHMAFDFSLIFCAWNAKKYNNAIFKWLKNVPNEAWPCHVLSNHDLYRSLGSPRFRIFLDEKAKVLATLMLTLKGTPFIYYGEEIGMRNSRIPRRKLSDPLGKKFWPLYQGRDSSRTPMQWDANDAVGLSPVDSWLPLNNDWQKRNVKGQMADGSGILNFYRELLKLRKTYSSLRYGEIISVIKGENNVMAYLRVFRTEKILVILNFSCLQKRIPPSEEFIGSILISTHREPGEKIGASGLYLSPFESIVLICSE